MNEIELLIQSYLDRANAGPVEVPEELIEEFGEACKAAFRKQFTEPRKGFTLRMSNIGRPTCQLQMEKSGAPSETPPYNHKIKMLLGDLGEAVLITVMKLAGVKVKAVQQPVKLELLNGTALSGTLDVIIETDKERVYDVKTASNWSFQNKFGKGFEAVAEDDTFGYVGQGYGYSKAVGKPFGGWIVLKKETGEIAVVEAPEDKVRAEAIYKDTNEVVDLLNSDAPFQRCFEPEAETFRKKPTGNRVLCTACSFCDFKQACWPDLQFRAETCSEAKSPKFKWYTYVDPKYDEAE